MGAHVADFEKLKELGCTDIKGDIAGLASLAEGWHNPSKNRLCILRYGDHVKMIKVPAAQNFIKHTALRGAANVLMADYKRPDYLEAQAAIDMVLAG